MPKKIYLEAPSPSNFHNFNTPSLNWEKSRPISIFKAKKLTYDQKITDFFQYNGKKQPMEVYYQKRAGRGPLPKRIIKKEIVKPANLITRWGDSQEYRDSFYTMTNEMLKLRLADLQEILKLNNLNYTGSKNTLCNRVTDGNLNGRIANCPNCRKGLPLFRPTTGEYYCKGYYDICGNWFACKSRFSYGQLPREDFKHIMFTHNDDIQSVRSYHESCLPHQLTILDFWGNFDSKSC